MGSRSRLSNERGLGWCYCLVQRTYARIAKLRLDQTNEKATGKTGPVATLVCSTLPFAVSHTVIRAIGFNFHISGQTASGLDGRRYGTEYMWRGCAAFLLPTTQSLSSIGYKL